jgi:protein-tyrosine-phosphatase
VNKSKILYISEEALAGQLAHAWTLRLKGNEYEPFALSLSPEPMDTLASHVMRELELSPYTSTGLNLGNLASHHFDMIVTLSPSASSAVERSPVEAKKIQWDVAPVNDRVQGMAQEEVVAFYREYREAVRSLVEAL